MKEFKPTWLYVKQHLLTGMLYFGKTGKEDPYTYLGSGKLWLRHIEKHGTDLVVTLHAKLYKNKKSCNLDALAFSKKHEVDHRIHGQKVNSLGEKWANLKPEDGLEGGVTTEGRKIYNDGIRDYALLPNSARAKSLTVGSIHPRIGKPHSEKTRQKLRMLNKGKSPPNKGKPMSEAQKEFLRNRPYSAETRAKIGEKSRQRKTSPATKALFSKQRKGEGNPMFGQISANKGKKWFNDGTHNHLCYEDDPKIEMLSLLKGRLIGIYFTDGQTSICLSENQEPPIGYKKGRTKNFTYWATDGTVNQRIKAGKLPPDGFVKGRTFDWTRKARKRKLILEGNL